VAVIDTVLVDPKLVVRHRVSMFEQLLVNLRGLRA